MKESFWINRPPWEWTQEQQDKYMEMYDTHIDRWFRGDLNREDVSEIEKLMAERNEARAHKDWELADRIKNRLVFMGVQILDYPEGSHWRRVGRFHIN